MPRPLLFSPHFFSAAKSPEFLLSAKVGQFVSGVVISLPPCTVGSPCPSWNFSRIHFQRFGRGDSVSRSGVIAWHNSFTSVRQWCSVRSRGHWAASGSQQVIGSIGSLFRPPWIDGRVPYFAPSYPQHS